MPETARILAFPQREVGPISPEAAALAAQAYLRNVDERASHRADLLSCPETLLAVCLSLREQLEFDPRAAFAEAAAIYRAISDSQQRLGSFDEREYFLGEFGLLAARACRGAGERVDAELWLERAEAGFRHTVNPSPLLANVAYERLALRYESGRYQDVIELAPMMAKSFARLEMPRETAKCIFLEALALKELGSHESAALKFCAITTDSIATRDPGLVGLTYVNLADIYVSDERNEEAANAFANAIPLLQKANKPAAIAHLKAVMGEALHRQGRAAEAIASYRASIEDYRQLGMATWVAYLRLVLSHLLLEQKKAREAEWQILAALPTIEEQQMVPEGFAAVALLRESVRQRRTDQVALAQLRDYLKTNN